MAALPATLFPVAIFFSSPSRFLGKPQSEKGEIWGEGSQTADSQGSSEKEEGSFWSLPLCQRNSVPHPSSKNIHPKPPPKIGLKPFESKSGGAPAGTWLVTSCIRAK